MTLLMDRMETESFIENPLAFWLDPRRWDDVNPNKEMFWDRDRPPLLEERTEYRTKTKCDGAKFNNIENFSSFVEVREQELEHHSLTSSGELSINIVKNKCYVQQHERRYPQWVYAMLEHPDFDTVFAVDYDLLGLPHCDDTWSHITYADVQFYSPRNPREYQDRVRYLRRAKFPTWEFRQDEARPFGKIVKIKARHYA